MRRKKNGALDEDALAELPSGARRATACGLGAVRSGSGTQNPGS
jgi:hypothetical protein